ncbi:fucose 4-O-acetylase-like acetyltransferase [Thermocatellispora tengchongensis]|uniref:Fucose 4-O-acetylase-like acetyltransferase n=1 Tax=Thermocatellispora tengchongensis TaxID=1073253 RepID=A0A840P3D9_9ACTN|nr:acyltransferase [Thermocatellispora tengchongensis]MBB5133499.1 fucose 4-O-acetylase-like acetyltransferase [Thermocatellispora tengchongensis]
MDLLRAVAIVAVVVGHWLAVHVTYGAEGMSGGSVLDLVPWTRPLTWLFQVMPIFFLVGGYANAASLASWRRRGGDAAGWTLHRTGRLVRPTTALLAVLTAGALSARAAGADPRLVGIAVWLAAIPLWFLIAYLAVVALTPLMYALHRRAGLAVPLALTALVGLGDLARLALGTPEAGQANFLLAWLAVHQLGFAWRDGLLPTRPAVALPLALLGLAALVLLTVFGPYPVSMVGIAGEEIQNTSPPTLALLALALAQTGIALLCHDPAARWLRRPRPWTVVVAVNSVIMTLFLWHMTAAVLGVLALYPTGLFPQPPAGSAEWVLLRLPWLAVLAVILAALVAVFGPVERRVPPGPAPQGGARGAALALAGVAAVLAGLLGIAVPGPGDHGPAGLATWALVAYFAGAAVLRYARGARRGERVPDQGAK